VKPSSRTIDRVRVPFDDPVLVADAGLLVPGTLMVRLDSGPAFQAHHGDPHGAPVELRPSLAVLACADLDRSAPRASLRHNPDDCLRNNTVP
jgi:hypothetical protein